MSGAAPGETLIARRFCWRERHALDDVDDNTTTGLNDLPTEVIRSVAPCIAALIPATDQMKTTGLVTLPGAFVGAIFGGVSPLEAGRFQLVVLAAIMAAGAITAVYSSPVSPPFVRNPCH